MNSNDQPHAEVTEEMDRLHRDTYFQNYPFYESLGRLADFVAKREVALSQRIDELRAELSLLHESHDAMAREVEELRAEKKELRYLAEKCFKYLGAQIRKRLLNETAYDGTQSLSKEIADRLDRLDRAAMTARKGRDAS